MGPKALFVSMHTTARGRVISKHCAELTCNMMYKGRLTPRGSIDICANAVIPDPNRPRHPFGWGRDCGPGLACGVHGCAAAFCGECVQPTGLHDGYTDVDKAGNQPWRMETCSFCSVSICEPHARLHGLLSSCDLCDISLCVDCTGEADLVGPFAKCGGFKFFGHPCRKRTCSKHTMVCVTVARDIGGQPPHKFQCIDWRVFDGATDEKLLAGVKEIFSWNGVGARDLEKASCVLMCSE